jgi:hypothetical protein
MPAMPRAGVQSALLAATAMPASRVAHARPIAVGWATVDLDRAATDLAAAFDLGVERFRPAARSVALGCACRIAGGVLPGGGSLVLLEPDTEGRLAASLARLGEGPTVSWLLAEEPMTSAEVLRAAGFAVSAERDGPFGPERLIVVAPLHGPHWLLVGPSPGTIAS